MSLDEFSDAFNLVMEHVGARRLVICRGNSEAPLTFRTSRPRALTFSGASSPAEWESTRPVASSDPEESRENNVNGLVSNLLTHSFT